MTGKGCGTARARGFRTIFATAALALLLQAGMAFDRTGMAAASIPGVDWTLQTPPAVPVFGYQVAHGNGLFVAVGTSTGNRVMTSPDGVTWTSRNSPNYHTWRGVAFGNDTFVAVTGSFSGGPADEQVMTSPDGINWTIRSIPGGLGWPSVTHGNGLFVAVGNDRVMTSPDGINWTPRLSPAANAWESVTYGNGRFVAVALSGTGNRVMTSPDGITWTERTSAADQPWWSVTYGNGLFVAVSSQGTGTRVMTSPDGIDWTLRTSAADNSWNAVTYGDGQFVAVSTGTSGVMTSPDGINWTLRTTPAGGSWAGVTYANGVFVAVSIGTEKVMTSGPIPTVLDVATTGQGEGRVTSTPAAIECGTEAEACQRGFTPGAQVSLMAVPRSGSVFTGWSGACSGTGACQVDMSEARSVTAEFKPLFKLSVSRTGTGLGTVTSSPAGIDCGTVCDDDLASGTVVTLSATPAPGSAFTGWSGACAGTEICVVTVDQAKSVTAEFTPEHALTVTRSGSGAGSVTSSPAGIDCGAVCSSNFVQGGVVSLTVSPNTNSKFTGWSGACIGTGPCTVTMAAAQSVNANFASLSPARFSKITLRPKKRTVRTGKKNKKLKLTVRVTNAGERSGTAKVRISSSNKKRVSAPKQVKFNVPAGKTTKRTFKVTLKRRQKGKARVTAKVANRSAVTVITLKR